MKQIEIGFPVKPSPPEWVQCTLPNVSLSIKQAHMFMTAAGFFLYARNVALGKESREIMAMKIDIRGPNKQTVVVGGKLYYCYIMPPHDKYPGWVDVI